MRRIASQVPQTVSRLLQSNLLQSPPTWYIPVLSNPPPVHPSRRSPPRPTPSSHGFADLPASEILPRKGRSKKSSVSHPRPKEIVYPEDQVRLRFFQDFPFEALRPTSLVEGFNVEEEHPVRGELWERLEQRGEYPTVEDCISFTMTLHERGIPLARAYWRATDEFVELRARHEQATLAAELEARHHGAIFKLDAFQRAHQQETRSLETLIPRKITASQSTSNKHRPISKSQWTISLSPSATPDPIFTAGKAYMERWTLPEPAPILSEISPEPLLVKDNETEKEMDDIDLVKSLFGDDDDLGDAKVGGGGVSLEGQMDGVKSTEVVGGSETGDMFGLGIWWERVWMRSEIWGIRRWIIWEMKS
ncbi:hypothetical protein TREMEDRAFT_73137 [Tremella mesenterica DSM 1558]|uniref:uncharacterized protein n=1 Tax=Tremella mesenterica (strain ATCC 24925 / CBS 8224 / DSM 1558 / NBRC 9311 / NRRL Y-6157 / RJB 2259-6 / UBC 559-6) TaxID=578456 RepID=UPI0003F49D17|nr:uncharacterized protein TREMEDRAFT_73137 [Tremella mesenterica DSM 1558]EIW73688.1 hypothetical protein TREMEDRAFT_73137 [Tremella mesenterica DSM 1558]